jgi:uncharacterized protein YegP (UPF0339 family)
MQYQLWKSDKDDNWYWRFVTNGREIFRGSEGYVNKAGAIHSMDIAAASFESPKLEQRDDGKWYALPQA